MSREVIDGVLHVIQVPKNHNERLFASLVRRAFEDSGVLAIDYYPPTYFILTDQTRRDRLPKNGPHPTWRLDAYYQFRLRGRPKAFSPSLRGHRVIVKGTVEPFQNHLGGYLVRPDVIEVGEYVDCPYHDDPVDAPSKGTSRVYCRHPVIAAITGAP